MYNQILVYLFNCTCKMGTYQQKLGIKMYVQISNGQMINLKNVSTIYKARKIKNDKPVFLITFDKFDHEDGWQIEFENEMDRDVSFKELMRKVSCLEWISD